MNKRSQPKMPLHDGHSRYLSRPRRRRSARGRGFTLIEMIVATTLLVIGVAGALSAINAATRATKAAEDVQTAIMLAQKQLAELETQPTSITSGDQSGTFDAPYSAYQWKQSIEPSDYSYLYQVTITVEWGSQISPQQRSITTYEYYNPNSTSTSSTSTSGTTGTTNGN